MASEHRKTKAKKILGISLAVIVIGLIAFRIYLPTLVTNYLNSVLSKLDGYRGHVNTVTIQLWRGAYSIVGLTVEKIDGHVPVPFVNIDAIDFSLAWKPIFRGNLSGKIELDHPVINFVEGKEVASQQLPANPTPWQTSVKKMFPLRIARLGVKQGEVHFRNFESDPPVDVYIDSIAVVATNLTNSKSLSRTLKATIDANAIAMNSGRVQTHIDLDPLNPNPTFAVAFKIEQLQLSELNGFFKHYLAVEAKTGTLDFYMEGAADQGEFKGYLKPLFQNLDLLKVKEDAGIGELFKALAVKFVSYTFKNHKEDQLGTKVEITGSVDHPSADVWSAVANFFHNWFIRALFKGFDSNHSTTP